MERPAAAQIGPHIWLLDRRGLSPGSASSQARIWAGWDFAQGCQASSVSPQNAPTEPLSNPHYFDDENNEPVISPGADVAPVITVSLSAPQIAQIATLLISSSPSEAAKKVDGYNGRNYREIRMKVDTVKHLIEGGKRLRKRVEARIKRETEIKAAALRERHARGENISDKARTLSQLLDDWIATIERQGKADNTLISYRGICANHLKPRMGAVDVPKLRAGYPEGV